MEEIYIINDEDEIVPIKALYHGCFAEGLYYYASGIGLIKMDKYGFFSQEDAKVYLEKQRNK